MTNIVDRGYGEWTTDSKKKKCEYPIKFSVRISYNANILKCECTVVRIKIVRNYDSAKKNKCENTCFPSDSTDNLKLLLTKSEYYISQKSYTTSSKETGVLALLFFCTIVVSHYFYSHYGAFAF